MLKVKGWKKIHHAYINIKKAGVTQLISDKLAFKANKIIRERELFYVMINPPRRHSHPKCAKQHSYKMCEAKTDSTERRNRHIYNYN